MKAMVYYLNGEQEAKWINRDFSYYAVIHSAWVFAHTSLDGAVLVYGPEGEASAYRLFGDMPKIESVL